MRAELKTQALEWLKTLISIQSFSREEDKTADFLEGQLFNIGFSPRRKGNNIWLLSRQWRANHPTMLLCSHHDTVRPVAGWTKDPFMPTVEDEKLIGLGSNDAGASLMALLATFIFYDRETVSPPFNLIFAAVAEEEVSGSNGIAALLPDLPTFDLAIIGEPTEMQMAIAEKGLMVVDAIASGKAGHAARDEGINALYLALEDIDRLRKLEFPKTSDLLGSVKVSVTQIEAGTQHNVVPDKCKFVIDVRTNELYSNKEALNYLQQSCQSQLIARSFRLNSSRIPIEHSIVQKGLEMGLTYFGSPTLSDQALISGPTIKIGCGDSARSHTADEFIYLSELEQGIDIYIQLLDELKL